MEKNLRQQKTNIIKIALFGPESTGKTTLAKQLANYYETEWVPEFARDYLQAKWEKDQQVCTEKDMMPIAYGQIALENEKLETAQQYVFCDTNLMVTKVFSEVYYGFCNPHLNEAALAHEYDLFFLTDIDVPWEKDDIRDNPNKRETVFSVFKQTLIDNNKPFITISGDKESRLAKATAIIDNLTIAKRKGFSSADFVEIYNHGIPFENILKQLKIFKKGISKCNLISPAIVNNGILSLSTADFEEKSVFFDAHKGGFKICKFIPASGAATRMFKFLIAFLNNYDIDKETINSYINRNKDNDLSIFIVGMDKFPFFKAVYKKLKEIYPDFDTLERDYKNYYFIKLLLSPEYFDFANKPKAVLPFHKYKTHIATPIEEHLNECVHYAETNKTSNLHFTVSEAHRELFEKAIDEVKEKVESQSGTQINISFSHQNKQTDSIAVDVKDNVFRSQKGSFIFRPGGHGALIENLNNIDADIIFIKNIDNVIQNNIDKTTLYKKALAGILIESQQKVFSYLDAIEKQQIREQDIEEIVKFLMQRLNIEMTRDFNKFTFENKINKIRELLDRPIRVCGMVKNEGEAGGGPFWIRNDKGEISLQIVESSQVDLTNKKQKSILENATHFNPVDLVCGTKNYKGEQFNLEEFVDHNTGFIVEKSAEGKIVKNYELPGLWNGGMSNWLTIFVAVPLITFNPVKTVNDLLKPPHQPNK
jgi:nicotinamide riboside kinase